MGQVVSSQSVSSLSVAGTLPTKVVPAGYMGEFGSGLWRVFQASGTFVVPAGVSRLRVRVVGGGGGGRNNGPGGVAADMRTEFFQ